MTEIFVEERCKKDAVKVAEAAGMNAVSLESILKEESVGDFDDPEGCDESCENFETFEKRVWGSGGRL